MRWVKGKRLRTRDSGHKPKNAHDLIVRREGWGFKREGFILRSELQVFFKRCWPVFMRSVNSVHFFGCQQFYNQKETTCSQKIHVLIHVANGFMDKIWYPDSAWKLGVIAATLTTMVAFLY